MRNQKGVSLITLVITIIVVIILAAIALGGGALDTAGQAQFSGFATEMGALKDTMSQAVATVKGEEAIRGNTRSDAQLINFIARGADLDENAWLTRADAEAIPCTPINRTYGVEKLGLPTRKVESANGSGQQVAYFVTPKGNVFCWPPYLYDNKSYVSNTVTARATKGGDEMDGTTATSADKAYITFGEGTTIEETIVVSKTAPSTTTWAKGTEVTDDTVSVWILSAADTTGTGGFARGFDFTGYDNTATTP